MEEETSNSIKSSKTNDNRWDTLKDEQFRGKGEAAIKKIKNEYYKSEYTIEEGGGMTSESYEWVKMTPDEIKAYEAKKATQKEQKLNDIRNRIKNIFQKKS